MWVIANSWIQLTKWDYALGEEGVALKIHESS